MVCGGVELENVTAAVWSVGREEKDIPPRACFGQVCMSDVGGKIYGNGVCWPAERERDLSSIKWVFCLTWREIGGGNCLLCVVCLEDREKISKIGVLHSGKVEQKLFWESFLPTPPPKWLCVWGPK